MAEIKPGGRTNGRGVSLIPIGDWRGEAGCRVHFGFLCFVLIFEILPHSVVLASLIFMAVLYLLPPEC